MVYHKIETLYERDATTRRLIKGEFRNNAVEFLKDNEWVFTEKIDGTNIRVYYDGYGVDIKGRTEKSDIPKFLSTKLNEIFKTEEGTSLMEQLFGTKKVVLYGEGFGNKIQRNGSKYIEDGCGFILFDVMVEGIFLGRDDVIDVAIQLGLDSVPIVFRGTLKEAEDYVKSKPKSIVSQSELEAEGIVGTPIIPLFDKNGNRVIVKIRVCDVKE